MDTILERLKQDHDMVRQMSAQIMETEDADERKTLFREMMNEVEAHRQAEEQVVYRRMEKTDDDEAKEFAFEGEQEHALVHQLMELLAKSRRKGDLKWHARFKALKDLLEHHIEEEESEAFPKIEELFDRAELEKMTEEFEKKKEKAAA